MDMKRLSSWWSRYQFIILKSPSSRLTGDDTQQEQRRMNMRRLCSGDDKSFVRTSFKCANKHFEKHNRGASFRDIADTLRIKLDKPACAIDPN